MGKVTITFAGEAEMMHVLFDAPTVAAIAVKLKEISPNFRVAEREESSDLYEWARAGADDEYVEPSMYEDADGGVAARVKSDGTGVILLWWVEGDAGFETYPGENDPERIVWEWIRRANSADESALSKRAALAKATPEGAR